MISVLVVDDNPDILEAIAMALEAENFSVIKTTQWDQVLPLAIEYVPDVIVMDVFLSGIDGRVLLESLKIEPQTKNVRVIMISAYPHIKESALKGGADFFLEKPFSINALVQAIRKVA